MLRLYLHYLYWILVFFAGIVQLYQLDSAIYKIGIPLLALVMFVFQFIEKSGQLKYPYWGIVLAFALISLFSARLNGINYFPLINFLIYTVLSYAYFVVLVNESHLIVVPRVIRFIKLLVFIQIPAIIIKFLVIGQSEGEGIGTLSQGGGSISTVFPLFMITFLFCLYLYREKRIYIFYLFCFLFFAIVGDKRAILFFVPLMILLSYLLFIRFSKLKLSARVSNKLVAAGIFSFVIFFLVVKTNKTLNPEHSGWGSFDLKHLASYVQSYTGSGDKDVSEMRRKDGLLHFFKHAVSGNTHHVLFGDGAGKLVQTKYSKHSGLMLDEYGIRYGGRMGIVWLLLQVGVLGTLIYLSLIIAMIAFVVKYYKDSPIYLAFLALSIVFFIDTFTYSYVFLRFEYLKGLYFVLFGLIYLDHKYKTPIFSELAKIGR